MRSRINLTLAIQILYVFFFISLVCSFRAVNTLTIALLIIAGVIQSGSHQKQLLQRLNHPFVYGCLSFFLFHLLALADTVDNGDGWADIRIKTGLLFIPLAACCTSSVVAGVRNRLCLYFILITAATSLYCLGVALSIYFHAGDSKVFFYHALVRPINGHAIYFAVLVFISLLFLIEQGEGWIQKHRLFRGILIVFLTIFLFLLSSKLVIGFYILYVLVYLLQLLKENPANRLLITGSLIFLAAVATIALATNNPVSRRFTDLMSGNLDVIEKEKYNPGMYFNGIQFRLLQWKFTGQLLNEHHGWLTGVGPGNVQQLLDQKYISTDMYVGDPARGDHGFLGYNTHNQFLETVLKTGIPGVLALIFICVSLGIMAWQNRKRQLSFMICFLLAWLLTEAVLERQFGIVIFTFFPLFMSSREKQA